MSRIMEMHQEFALSEGCTVKRVDGGGAMLAPFVVTFSDDRVRILMTIDVVDGHPSLRDHRIQPVGHFGLETMMTDIGGFNVPKLMSHACAGAALKAGEEGTFTPSTDPDDVESVIGPMRRRRAPVTDERLAEVARAYTEVYRRGHLGEFARAIKTGERQAWRLVDLARERGFLPKEMEG